MVNEHRDSRLWTSRRLSKQSFQLLEHASLQMQGEALFRKRVGGYALTLIYPSEISRAMRRSPLRDIISENEVYDKIVSELPTSVWQPVVGEVGQIEQYRNFIGVVVKYSDFSSERAAIREALSDTLHIQYDGAWHCRPHVSFARGSISNIANPKEIRSLLPDAFDMSPVYDGLGRML